MWKTQDGRKIKESEMTDSHLVNALTYLVRREQERLYRRDQYDADLVLLHATCRDAPFLVSQIEDGDKLVVADFVEGLDFIHLAQYLRGFVYSYKWKEAVRRVAMQYQVLANVADTRRLNWRTDPL